MNTARIRNRTKKKNVPMWITTVVVTLVVLYGLYLGTMAIYEKVVNSATVEAYVGRERYEIVSEPVIVLGVSG